MLHDADPSTTLTYLARIAGRKKQARAWLARAFEGRRLDELVEQALEVAVETGEPVGEVLAEAVNRQGSLDLVEWLARSLVDDDRFAAALPLKRVEITANRKILSHLRAAWPQPEPDQRGYIAGIAHNLGSAQKELGLWQEARRSFEEAIHQYRYLEQPFHLALALNNFCALLSLLGELDLALDASLEAVDLYRGQAGGREGNLDLAGALVNLAGCFSDLDRSKRALEAIEEGVDLYRPYRTRLGDFENHRFANALICLGNQLELLGRYEAALEAMQEGVALRQRLASDWPTAFEPDLALALANLTKLLDRLGRDEEAAETLGRAVELFRRAADHYRPAFEPGLAWALSLSGQESGTSPSQLKGAVSLAEEAVRLFRRLAAQQPTAFALGLARALNALSSARESAGDYEGALLASDEVISAIGPQPAQHQQRILAWSLIYRCRALSGLGRWQEALKDARRTVELLSGRWAQHRDVALERAEASHQLGICLHEKGRFAEAAEATRGAIAIFQRLMAAQPTVFPPNLACVLDSLGNHLHALGRLDEAIATSREAVDLYRRERRKRGQKMDLFLASALNNLALRLYHLGRAEEALEPSREAIELYRAHPTEDTGYTHHLADCLHNLGTILDALGQESAALQHFEEATKLRRVLLRCTPGEGVAATDLARSLTNLGAIHSQEGAKELAVQATSEAVGLFRQAIENGLEFLRSQLALALGNLAQQEADQGSWPASMAAAEEAVQLFLVFCHERPADFSEPLAQAFGQYVEAAKHAEMEIDLHIMMAVAAQMGVFDAGTSRSDIT